MPRVTAPDQEQYTVLAHDCWNWLGCVTHDSNITEAEAKLDQLAAGSWFQEAVVASYCFLKHRRDVHSGGAGSIDFPARNPARSGPVFSVLIGMTNKK